MDKPHEIELLEKAIRVEGKIFGEEKAIESMQSVVHYIQANYGLEQQTRLGQHFVASAMSDLVDPVVAAFVHHTLESAKEH